MENELKKASTILRRGGIILYPTDTVWGIGCDATQAEAVLRIYRLKERAADASMLVLIDSADYLPHYVEEVPPMAIDLIACAGRPLTIVYPQAKNVAPELVAADGSLGIRVTREAFSNRLCRMIQRPLVSTSANRSGQPAPADFSSIEDAILQGVDYVVNYRRAEKGKSRPSSVIRLEKNGIIQIIRP
jgi:L-threonylcarbamoyladenylate synthase